MGEDIGVYGGAFKVTDGFIEEFGADRVMDTPLAESGIVGTAVGAAVVGLRPVCEMQFADFVSCGFDQIINVAGKMLYRQGLPVNITIRLPSGGGFSGGPFHSQNPEAWFMHSPGLKVVAPSTAEDAKGLIIASIRDPNPVIYMEHKNLYRHVKGEVPEGSYETPFSARVAREGTDLVVITYGAMVHTALEATEDLDDASIMVLDLRSLVPLDERAILDAVHECSKVVIVDEANQTCAAGAQVVGADRRVRLRGPRRTDRARRLAATCRSRSRRRSRPPSCRPSIASGRPAVSSSSTDPATIVDVTMPQMGVSVAEGTVVEWRKQRGDWVEADETICEISTDKIDTEVPAPASGRLVEVLVAVGDDGRRRRDARADRHRRPAGRAAQLRERVHRRRAPRHPPPRPPARSAATVPPPPPAPPARAAGGRTLAAARRYSPVVQRIADEHGVDLDEVQGTGRDGRVQKKDVMAVVAARGGGGARARRRRRRGRADAAHREPLPARRRRLRRAGRTRRPRDARCRACARRSACT